MTRISESLMEELTLRDSKHGHLLGEVGITLNLYYAQNMFDLVDVFRSATDAYLDFIPPGTINFYNNHEYWRPYKARSLGRLINRFSSKTENGYWLDLAQIAFEEDEDGPYPIDEIGGYGLCLHGVIHERFHSFSESSVCAIHCEFPADELFRSGYDNFLRFTECLAELAPFDSGHAGYTFKYSGHSDQRDEHAWIGHKAPRFLSIYPQSNHFEHYTRHRVANVNWLTLLGTELSQKLGNVESMRAKLSSVVTIKPLVHGTMLIAGAEPPIGDVNCQAPDLEPLREVARLTRPLWIDDDTVKNNIINYFWFDENQRDRWINRFELTL